MTGDAPIPMRADPTRMQQVIGNLVSNAVKFTSAGGRVRVVSRREGAHAEIVVSDTGEGIAADALPFAFERFRQADASITRRHGGLGLGLAIARHVVELHGGTIEAQSDGPGRGATFHVCLPLMPPRLAGARAGRSPNDGLDTGASLQGLSLLVVDDDFETRLALEAVLEQAGARVTIVASMQEALRAYSAERPDVVITDLAMPVQDGYQLLRALRREQGDSAIPVLALTGAATPQERQLVLEAGFTLHLTKPIDPAEVLSAISMVARGAS